MSCQKQDGKFQTNPQGHVCLRQHHNTCAFIITALQLIYTHFNTQSASLTEKAFSGTTHFN